MYKYLYFRYSVFLIVGKHQRNVKYIHVKYLNRKSSMKPPIIGYRSYWARNGEIDNYGGILGYKIYKICEIFVQTFVHIGEYSGTDF